MQGAVVAADDDERVLVTAADRQDRRQRPAGVHLEQVGRDMVVLLVEKVQLAGTQDVLGQTDPGLLATYSRWWLPDGDSHRDQLAGHLGLLGGP